MATLERGTWFRQSRIGPATEVLRGLAGGITPDTVCFVGDDSGSPVIYTTPWATIKDLSPTFTSRTPAGSDVLRGIAYDTLGDVLLAVGDNGVVEVSDGTGVTWSSSNITANDLYRTFALFIDTASRFIAVGDLEIWGRDSSGVWTNRLTGTEQWRGVGWRASGWVVVGRNQYVTNSATGLAASWAAPFQLSGSGDDLVDVATNGAIYVVCGQNGSFWRSATGASGSWTSHPVPGSPDLTSVTGNGTFGAWIVCDSSGNTWYTEDDGDNWTQSLTTAGQPLRHVEYSINNAAVAAGDSGGVWVSFDQTQADFTSTATEPTAGDPFAPNADMSGDAVRRLVTQFRSGRG